MKPGDTLLIQGMHFKVVVGEDILDIIEEFEGENDQSDDEYEDESSKKPDEERVRTPKPGEERVKTPKPGSAKSRTATEPPIVNHPEGQLPESTETSIDEMISNVERTLKKGYTMLPLRSTSRGVTHRVGEVGLDHIKLDRTWLFDDVEYLGVYRVAKKPFYSEPFFQVFPI